ncbi:MAG: glycosyltransferase family 10 [Chitinophagaceae bacterium]
MIEKKFIVLVTASFAEGADLFNWIKRYAHHADKRFAYYNEFAFTTTLLPEYDAILVLNTAHEKMSVLADPAKVIALMMEPGIKTEHPWMFKQLEQYAEVLSPVPGGTNTILSHGFMGWYFEQNTSELENMAVPQKTKPLSCIVSDLKQLKGHRLRLKFVTKLKQELQQTDMFGKGSNYISNKMDGLLPYRYSIAIENSSIPYYFTEKINDCFLAYTVPFYYGCKNISKFFPEKSFIPIDINDTTGTIKKIRDIINNDDWSSRLDAVKEARNLVLHQYQPLAGCAAALQDLPASSKQKIELTPVKKELTIKNIFSRILRGQKSERG